MRKNLLKSYLVCVLKRLSRKKFERHLLLAEQRNVSTQTMGLLFLDRTQSLKNSKSENELIEIVDCLIHGHDLIGNSLLYLDTGKY